jgi:hypothetical protein
MLVDVIIAFLGLLTGTALALGGLVFTRPQPYKSLAGDPKFNQQARCEETMGGPITLPR